MLSCTCFAMGFYSSSTVPAQPRVRLFIVMGGCETLPNRAVVWWPLPKTSAPWYWISYCPWRRDSREFSCSVNSYLHAAWLLLVLNMRTGAKCTVIHVSHTQTGLRDLVSVGSQKVFFLLLHKWLSLSSHFMREVRYIWLRRCRHCITCSYLRGVILLVVQ